MNPAEATMVLQDVLNGSGNTTAAVLEATGRLRCAGHWGGPGAGFADAWTIAVALVDAEDAA